MTNSKKEKVTKYSKINTSLLNTIKYWLFLLRSRHNLQKKQEELLAHIILQYIKYSADITNPKFIWKMVFDYESRQEISKAMDIPTSSFENYLTKLRQNNVVIDNRVNPNYMPGITPETKQFILQFEFNIKENEESKK